MTKEQTKALEESLEDSQLRAGVIIHLASMWDPNNPPASPIEDAICDDPDEIAEALGGKSISTSDDDGGFLWEAGKRGFLVKMETPVPRFHASIESYSFSWGHFARQWFYNDDLNAIYAEAVEWRKKYIEQEWERHNAQV